MGEDVGAATGDGLRPGRIDLVRVLIVKEYLGKPT